MTALRPPLTAAEVAPEWIAMIRKMISDAGMQCPRAHPNKAAIELKSMTDNQWRALMLPNSMYEFASTQDRDAVLGRLL